MKPKSAPMESIQATDPTELDHLDYLTIEANETEKDASTLVISDNFTRYAHPPGLLGTQHEFSGIHILCITVCL